MVEPVIGAAIAKVATNAAGEVVNSGLLTRVLGPSADELGEALKRFTAFRTRNVGRVVEKAAKKSRPGTDQDQVHPRVAHRILDEGSYCDDEIMADYLGGVLAGSRTPNGRDDRAVAWSELVTSLSSVQVRAHYLLYSAWARLLRGRHDLNLGVNAGRAAATLDVELTEFAEAVVHDSDLKPDVTLAHTIPGLIRVGLLSDTYGYGVKDEVAPDSKFGLVLRVQPSVAGIELFGWAMGMPDLTKQEFVDMDLEVDDSLPGPLSQVLLPRLADVSEGQG